MNTDSVAVTIGIDFFNTLPPEVAIKILRFAISAWPHTSNQSVPWTSLRLTCRPWYYLVERHALFWTYIGPLPPHAFVRKALEASQQADIEHLSCAISATSTVSPLIFLHSTRIRSLRLRLRDGSSLSQTLSPEYTKLQKLYLVSGHVQDQPNDIHLRTTTACHPSLFDVQALTLAGIELRFVDLVSFRALQHLELFYILDRTVFQVPFAPFMAMLSELVGLHRLLLTLAFDSSFLHPLDTPVILPDLGVLQLRFLMPDAGAFLASLVVRRLHKLDVKLYELRRDDVTTRLALSSLRRIAAASPLWPTTSIHAAPSPSPNQTTVSVNHTVDHASPSIKLEVEARDRPLANHVDLFVDCLALQTIKTLELNSYSIGLRKWRPPPQDLLVDWNAFLARLPNLTTVEVDGTGMACYHLPVALATQAPGGSFPCPRLTTIYFSYGGFYRQQCRAWFQCLERRQRGGYVLQRLRFWTWKVPRLRYWIDMFEDVCVLVETQRMNRWYLDEGQDSDSGTDYEYDYDDDR